MASTADFDRAGDSISADAWTKGGLQNFEKNPIILFNHDYNRPIGRATGLKSWTQMDWNLLQKSANLLVM